jgi:4-hydroxy-tetrahydrodipicolinate synthase
MNNQQETLSGIWLPLITPFRDGALDEGSLVRLVEHFRRQPIVGMILAATTGEGLTLDETELVRLVEIASEALGGKLPLFLGVSGADTSKVVAAVGRAATLPLDGFLVACPYYIRPGQAGLRLHFEAVAQATDRPILIYNIPYRTGVNIMNDTLLALADIDNIVGLKDCCADMAQSFDLLNRRPSGFSVLTGEDALFYGALMHGSDGGILASAHAETAAFADVRERLLANDPSGALRAWRNLAGLPQLLFTEPSPAPIKHWLWRQGLIASPEVRLPITGISSNLAKQIDSEMERRDLLIPAL